jgi:DNA processing protein
VTDRDLVACSLAPSGRRRTAALRDLLNADADGQPHPIAWSLEQLAARVLPDGDTQRAFAERLREDADAALRRGAAAGLEVIGWLDARYPPRLRTIPDPPPALWTRGDVRSLDSSHTVAIVGSRAASSYGLAVAQQLAHDLAAAGMTVVSGLARGCDAAAHRGALEAGGRTVAVVGCGADVIYPREHRSLFDEISAAGVIVSELPPGAPPLPVHFPMRNRIISGLSAGVVIVEASSRSGSLITAASALEQGREVMAVPGNVLSERHTGCHELLRDGACLVQSARDVIEALGWMASIPTTRGRSAGALAGGDLDSLLASLTPGEELDVDTLAARSGLDPADLLAGLTRLELAGAVARLPAGRFVRPHR